MTDWATLKSCVESTTDQTVTITSAGTIDVPAGAQATITKSITLTANTTADPVLTSTANGDTFFSVADDGNLIIGKDAQDKSFSYKNGKRFFAYLNVGASLTINNGSFSGNDTTESKSHDMGTLVYNNGGTVDIYNGTFDNNKAANGGVIYQTSGTTTISGGSFTGNAQEIAECTRQKNGDTTNECRDGKYQRYGGGVIHSNSGTVSIQGAVTFKGNHANASAFMSGGGAIYAQGTLWILNDMNDSSKKPLFDGNWTATGVGSENTQYLNNDTVKKVLPTGGAGGAIFLQDGGSKGYFMGGVYRNNTSGYLGGAIYTEENSTSFMGKAVAENNVAGHFGGGLWLCPSGSAQASEGGNVALFDNKLDYNIDSNTDNHGDQYMAGEDFAMMNPKGKNRGQSAGSAGQAQSVFRLLNTWFMDRSEKAVNWYWDGTPKTKANGFADKYQAPGWPDHDGEGDYGGFAGASSNNVTRYGDSETNYPQRFQASAADGSMNKLPVQAPSNLLVTNPRGYGINKQVDDNSRTWDESKGTLTVYTGIALKADLTAYGNANKESAKSNASVLFTNNAARLSGGAFGSNGVISFSNPYAASWDKVDAADATKFLKGSVWTLKTPASGTEAGGAMNPSLRPADCTASAKASNPSCWQTVTEQNADGNTTQWLSVEIADNGPRDTNPEIGKIGVDNLKPGKYYLTEKAAPDNYKLTTNVYTFEVVAEADGLQKEEPKISLYQQNDAPDNLGPVANDGTAIGNTIRSGGVSWSKVNKAVANITNQAYLKDSGWTLTKYKTDTSSSDMDDSFGSVVINDYVSEQTSDRTCLANTQSKYCDINPGVGRFTVTGLPLGTYKLVESTVPGGYVKPDSGTYYTFTVEDGKTATLTKWENGHSAAMPDTEVINVPTEIAWEKVASDDHGEVLNGAKWTISKWSNGQTSNPREVVDCTTNECSKKSNSDTAYVDKNPEAGHFGIQNLERGTEYKLTETQAPNGYTLPDPNNTYAIITVTDTGDTYMTLHGLWNQPKLENATVCLAPSATTSVSTRAGSASECVLTNVRSIAALPFTGGTDARSWLLIGGIAAVAAAIVLALTNEYRKRKGLA
ncbi:MSCRAMM family protein [Bifidobacterium felsineum]|uniref:MSCRAMM family protein n=1 Tax=Bifidobacterium felsineum TaxID=2045440 RepID=UPI001BDD9403|nr:hypothetical protein [Bifidobacterium felsineum]